MNQLQDQVINKMNISDFLIAINYNIQECVKYQWDSFGPNALITNYWNQQHDETGVDISAVFDGCTQQVYKIDACCSRTDCVYQWVNPNYLQAYHTEFEKKSVNLPEEKKLVNIADDDQMMMICKTLYSGQEYNHKVSIDIDLPDDLLFKSLMMAHEQDITFNEYVSKVLDSYINEDL